MVLSEIHGAHRPKNSIEYARAAEATSMCIHGRSGDLADLRV